MLDQPSKVRLLDCCVCGGGAYGRQWHNRDTGYGLCDSCADWLKSIGTSEQEMKECYGVEGIHYKVTANK